MEDINIEKEYKSLKFNLPPFKDMDDEFEISSIDKKIFLLRSLRRKMNDKILFFFMII